jgi:hypothetical protein
MPEGFATADSTRNPLLHVESSLLLAEPYFMRINHLPNSHPVVSKLRNY